MRGATVIFGRRSHEIFGPDLTESTQVVVTRSPESVTGQLTATSVEEAHELALSRGAPVFCAGGAAIYEACLPLATEMHLSFIEGEHDGDVFFPEFDEADWVAARREPRDGWELVLYRRKV